jgi:hypothetical protein
VQSPLSANNYQSVQRALSRLDRGELVRLDGLARQESLVTRERIRNAAAIGHRAQPSPVARSVLAAGDVENPPKTTVAKKKSTVKGEAQEKIISALTLHHRYQDGSCLNQEPIKVGELARGVEVAKSSVSRFFKKRFGVGEPKKDGHKKYIGVCRDTGRLVASLRLLNREYSPSDLYGRNPPNEGQKEEDD